MEKQGHREKGMALLEEELRKDRARTNIVAMSEIGLVEMTRKRTRPSLIKTVCEPCSYCDGRGYVKQRVTVAHEIMREIEREHRGPDPAPSRDGFPVPKLGRWSSVVGGQKYSGLFHEYALDL